MLSVQKRNEGDAYVGVVPAGTADTLSAFLEYDWYEDLKDYVDNEYVGI